ncbi:hypothetical protein [Novosphingobium sp.]|uniref:hypothetical protein n=1 Tax=Novosphingobium sp. TaxID=1874826 RepID=UPI00286AC276|nr:hypothetical protein [Novosphingobium sp.]
MIASPALTALAALPIPGSMPPGEPAEAVQGPDFLTILAQSARQTLPASDVPIDPATFTAPILPQPAPASAAATTGKILPPALPQTALPEAALAAETTCEADAPPSAASPTVLLHRAALPRGQAKKAEPAGPILAEEPAPTITDEADLPEAAPEPAPVIALLSLPAPALAALTAHAPQQPGHSEHAAVLRALPALPAPSRAVSAEPEAALPIELAAPQTALAVLAPRVQRRLAPAAPLIETAASSLSVPADPTPNPAPAPLRQVRVAVALAETLPRATRAEAGGLIRLPAALPGDEGEAAAPAMLPLAAPPAAPQSLLAAAPAAPPTRPQDFAALIDRLSAAREAAAPQSVTVSLAHADFGRVQLNFRHEDGTLAVSLASADPDFARIAAQAAPPVIALAEPRSAEAAAQQSGSLQTSARSDSQSAQTAPGSQQRGHGQDRRGDGPHRFESQPRARASAERPAGRSGIFA